MARYLFVLALIVALPHAARAQAQPGTLRLDVVAVDRKGAPVADLRLSEFEVWISGYRVPVADVHAITPATHKRTLVLLLDDLAVAPAFAVKIKEAARHFVDKLAPGDRLAVMSLGGSTFAPTDDRARLRHAVDTYYRPGMPFRPEDGSRQVLQTIAAICERMAETVEGRKTIVAIGAGWLFDTPLPPPGAQFDLQREWTAAMRAMAATSTSLYVIDPAGVGAVRGGVEFSGSGGFARETGGHAFVNTNDLAGAADRILAEAGTYYVLSMPDPPVQRAADLREVKVTVRRSAVTVRARTGIRGKP